MNRFAYHMSGYAIKAFSGLSKTNVRIHESEEIPDSNASLIFTANHFTRMETIFLPYYIHNIIKKPIWSLASADLFQGGLKGMLDSMGAISTKFWAGDGFKPGHEAPCPGDHADLHGRCLLPDHSEFRSYFRHPSQVSAGE